jgi:hypothetical protein
VLRLNVLAVIILISPGEKTRGQEKFFSRKFKDAEKSFLEWPSLILKGRGYSQRSNESNASLPLGIQELNLF